MTTVVDEPLEEKLRSERVNETRYERTFTCQEVLDLLRAAVLAEAGRRSWEGDKSTVVVLGPGVPEELTVKVIVPEGVYR